MRWRLVRDRPRCDRSWAHPSPERPLLTVVRHTEILGGGGGGGGGAGTRVFKGPACLRSSHVNVAGSAMKWKVVACPHFFPLLLLISYDTYVNKNFHHVISFDQGSMTDVSAGKGAGTAEEYRGGPPPALGARSEEKGSLRRVDCAAADRMETLRSSEPGHGTTIHKLQCLGPNRRPAGARSPDARDRPPETTRKASLCSSSRA